MFNRLRPSRVVAKLRQQAAVWSYDLDAIEVQENAKFEQVGLNRDSGLARLDMVLADMGARPFDDLDGTDSIHWLLFSSLSVSARAQDITRILEIGTFRGKTALLLHKLFPHAHVTTCDLPITDPIMRQTYRRETGHLLADYLSVRDSRVQREGITFVETNSFFLPEKTGPEFDLVWVDGGHLFPEVAWDICNAWHLCRPGGLILCDDIIPDPRGGDAYGSDASHVVLQYIAARTQATPTYFLKRRNPHWSADAVRRKYVAWIERPLSGT